MFKYLDAYTLRARLAPAIIATAPAFALIALLISWDALTLSNTIATLGMGVLLFALSDFARGRGKTIEPALFASLGGKPSMVMLRHSDPTFAAATKARYVGFLAGKLGEVPPSNEDERRSPNAADAFYERCGTWLRENTRNEKKFGILFNENVTYGYRRNLFALKWPAPALNLVVVLISLATLFGFTPFLELPNIKARVLVVLTVAAVHAVYIVFGINRRGLGEASRTYARQLILSCETFLKKVTEPPAKRSRTKAQAG